MKRKITVGLLVVVLLLTAFTSCNGTTKSIVKCGEEVVSLMAEMVKSEDYISLNNLTAAHNEIISQLRDGNYSKSLAVYELSIAEAELLKSFGEDFDRAAFSEELYKHICSSAYGSLVSNINQKNSFDALVVSNAFTAQKSFAGKKMDTNKTYLYVFENGCPILITFLPGENRSFRAIGHFIINDTFATDDELSIIKSCEVLGVNGVTVKKQ